ncbi:MAG: NifB/NifX family molybdenum-iron cluster-binding protein [Thermodesulfobacteriota bacterium]
MIKVAVPLFKDRISPHFGASPKVLLVMIDGGVIQSEATWDVGGESPMEMARRLVSLGIQYVICGGIHRTYKDWLITHGITVMENQRGVAMEAIKKLLNEFVNETHDQTKASSFIEKA